MENLTKPDLKNYIGSKLPYMYLTLTFLNNLSNLSLNTPWTTPRKLHANSTQNPSKHS